MRADADRADRKALGQKMNRWTVLFFVFDVGSDCGSDW